MKKNMHRVIATVGVYCNTPLHHIVIMLLAFSLLAGCSDKDTKITSETPTVPIYVMSGAQEVPAVTTNAMGTAVFSLNAAKTELSYDITVTGLSGPITSAHIHNAPVGANGAPVLTLTFTDNHTAGVWKSTDTTPLTAALVSQLEASAFYVNVHTADHTGGEIRGQIQLVSSGSKGYTAKLAGNQEVPMVTTTAVGTGGLFLNANKTELAYDITVTGLSGAITSAHIHNAAVGANGGPVLSITFTNNHASGVWKSTDTLPFDMAWVSQLEAGALYVNVHTAANPGGEIRGQVTADP